MRMSLMTNEIIKRNKK